MAPIPRQKQSVGAGTAVQFLAYDQRQQGPRGAREYKKTGAATQHRPQFEGMPRVTQAGAHRAEQPFGGQLALPRRAPPALQREDHRKKRQGIEYENRARPGRRDDQTRQRRTDGARDIHADGVEADGRMQLGARH